MRLSAALPLTLLTLLHPLHATPTIDPTQPTTLPSGLLITPLSGPVTCTRHTHPGDKIAVHYRGTLTDGTAFDDSYSRGSPFTFVLGAGRVIRGWDEGLEGMCVGQTRKLTIPPELGYGDRGAGALIPGGATLVFETYLVDVLVEGDGVDEVDEFLELGDLVELEGGEEEDVVIVGSLGVGAGESATKTADAVFTIATAATTKPGHGFEEGEKVDDEVAVLEDQTGLGNVTATSKGGKGDPEDGEAAQCSLLGPFALLVQGALGALALLTLVWKRWRETNKRPWKIFLFDVSKQVIGSMLTHVINLAMSMLSSIDMANAVAAAAAAIAATDAAQTEGKQGRTPNPCSYYLINLAIDTTLGVPVLYLLLKVLHGLFRYTPLANPPQSIKSGNYGTPPRVTWYLKQLMIYCIGLVGMKLFVFFLFAALPWLPWIGDWALRWTNGNEALEITFALFIFPLAMNAVQYWVIDNFIMDKKTGEQGYNSVNGDEGETRGERERMLDGEDGEEDDALLGNQNGMADPLKEPNPTPIPVYNDGSSSSSKGKKR